MFSQHTKELHRSSTINTNYKYDIDNPTFADHMTNIYKRLAHRPFILLQI